MDTSSAPAHRLDHRVTNAWRMQALAVGVPAVLVAAAATSALSFVGASTLLAILPITLALVALGLWLTVVPELRYRRWRWEVTAQEVRLQRGLIVIERTVVPMARVQHVDTSQGPILGAFHLSEVRIWTAAGAHTIPALGDKHAAELRDSIAHLAQVTDDDGL
jgi:membrane protein YdbS with pleckstrin-like domain